MEIIIHPSPAREWPKQRGTFGCLEILWGVFIVGGATGHKKSQQTFTDINYYINLQSPNSTKICCWFVSFTYIKLIRDCGKINFVHLSPPTVLNLEGWNLAWRFIHQGSQRSKRSLRFLVDVSLSLIFK